LIKNIIFDFGGVLVDWDRRYLYEKMFADKADMDFFLANICHMEWNNWQDAGRSFEDGFKELLAQFPEYESYIHAYFDRWPEMLKGPILESVDLLHQLQGQYRLFGLTNLSAECYPLLQKRFPFINELEGVVVSGIEGVVKPDPGIFEIILHRYGLKAGESLFIDDNIDNINTAKAMGFLTIHFQMGDAYDLDVFENLTGK